MKIAAGTVSDKGYDSPEANRSRLNIYRQVVEMSKKQNVDLVCLPGGYLHVLSEKDMAEIAKKLVRQANKYKIAIAVGVDVGKTKKDTELPQFAACWSPMQKVLYRWRQRSTNSHDWRAATMEECSEQRTLLLANGKVEILVCGELFNPKIPQSIVSRSNDITAVVDLVHDLYHFRATGSMKILAKGGLTTLCSGHVKRRSGQKFRYDPVINHGWVCNSSRGVDIPLEDPPRVELKIWDV